MFYIYPYNMASRSARTLRDALGGRLIRLRNSRYVPRGGHKIINWGNSNLPDFAYDSMLNKPQQIRNASNKRRAFRILRDAGVRTVPWTDDHRQAQSAVNAGATIYARTTLTGHSGEGIVVCHVGYAVPQAPLYTIGIPNSSEYRVHVAGGQVIFYQKKCRRNRDPVSDNSQNEIRNLGSGWVYRSNGLRQLDRVKQLGIEAINALGLDFGAVDIIMDEDGSVYVLEVNTAVGLEDQTLNAYLEYFENL